MRTDDLINMLQLPNLSKSLKAVDKKIKSITKQAPLYISQPLNRLSAVKGKRLRPMLLLASAELGSRPVYNEIVAAATSIELMHLASLIHDDIIDQGTTRWGRPTVFIHEGTSAAVLVGDYLIAKAQELANEVDLRTGQLLARAFRDLVSKQAIELTDLGNMNRTTSNYYQTIEGKTAALFAAACEIGASLGGLSQKDSRKLGDFGRNFGLAYQLADDVLDLVADPTKFGKSVGADLSSGNYTLPVLLALQSPKQPIIKQKILSGTSNQPIAEWLIQEGFISRVITTINELCSLAEKTVADLPITRAQQLAELPSLFIKQLIEKQSCLRL